MKDRSSVIFNNPMDKKTIKKAKKNKDKYIKRFGDDSDATYHLGLEDVPSLSHIGVRKLVHSSEPLKLPKKPLIIGNIRMGFGHYRISIAMASAAKAMGYDPLWLDLASFESTGSKMIRAQNDLYSLASRISQKSKLFNALIWEPLNSEGFKKLTYNAVDQKASELLVPLFHDIPRDTPYIATHVWPSQGAVHAGFTHVVNAIPDNWPMALHLSEGAIHTVQTPFAYLGYKMLNGFAKKPLNGIDESELFKIGHYVDHELVADLEKDCDLRIKRLESDKPVRILLSVGGAGAGARLFLDIVSHLMPLVEQKKVSLFLNYGDHLNMHEYFKKHIEGFEGKIKTYFDDYEGLNKLASDIREGESEGISCIYHKDIFEAVYSTNLLMRVVDLLITKPSELAYYPVPKLMMRHIGGHEVYGAIHAQEYGDSTWECPDKKSMNQMLDRLLGDKQILVHMNKRIKEEKKQGLYDGAYKAVSLASKGKAEL